MKEKFYVGIDVAKAKLNLAFDKSDSIEEFEIENSIKRICNYFIKEKKRTEKQDQSLHVVFEATGVYHLFLAKTLSELEINFTVLNPIKIANFKKETLKRGKTDPVDARAILSFAQTHNPEPTRSKSMSQNKIASLLKALEDQSDILSSIRHRLEACNHNPYCDKQVIRSFHAVIVSIKKQIEKLEDEIQKQVKETAPEEWKYLMGIKGVGKRMAAVTIAFFGDFSTFENCKQVVAFAGLDPIANKSGKFCGKSKISKQGNRYIRKILYMCALSAMRHNTACKEKYEQLLLNGKKKKQARVAVAHKLLRQIFAVVKYKREWDDNYGGKIVKKIA